MFADFRSAINATSVTFKRPSFPRRDTKNAVCRPSNNIGTVSCTRFFQDQTIIPHQIFIQLKSILRLKRTISVILLPLNFLTEIKLSLTFIRFIDFDVTKHANSKLLKIGLLLHRLCLGLHYLSQKHSCDWSVETKRYLLLVNF